VDSERLHYSKYSTACHGRHFFGSMSATILSRIVELDELIPLHGDLEQEDMRSSEERSISAISVLFPNRP
jgi:hypothetical protein